MTMFTKGWPADIRVLKITVDRMTWFQIQSSPREQPFSHSCPHPMGSWTNYVCSRDGGHACSQWLLLTKATLSMVHSQQVENNTEFDMEQLPGITSQLPVAGWYTRLPHHEGSICSYWNRHSWYIFAFSVSIISTKTTTYGLTGYFIYHNICCSGSKSHLTLATP